MKLDGKMFAASNKKMSRTYCKKQCSFYWRL